MVLLPTANTNFLGPNFGLTPSQSCTYHYSFSDKNELSNIITSKQKGHSKLKDCQGIKEERKRGKRTEKKAVPQRFYPHNPRLKKRILPEKIDVDIGRC